MHLGTLGKILFIPASGPKGTGEYTRSLNIARHIQKRNPEVVIHFLLNKQSPLASACPFPVTLLHDTPAYATEEVNRAISDFTPDLVLFDATGRAAQLRKAKEVGAYTVFIAQNSRVLSRGLGLNRLASLDELWIVQPSQLLSVSGYNRMKARIGNVTIREIGPVFPLVDPEAEAEALTVYSGLQESYILVNPGGGGHKINGQSVVELFYEEAKKISEKLQMPIVFVCGPNFSGTLDSTESVRVFPSVSPEIFNILVFHASGFVSGGGGALFQAVAYGIPTLTLAISPDQQFRIDVLAREYEWILGVKNSRDLHQTLFPAKPPRPAIFSGASYLAIDKWLALNFNINKDEE